MRSVRHLLRQPLKSLAGILLTAVAVAVLCVSVSQTLAARDTSKRLLELYRTVALTSKVGTQEDADWIHTLPDTHPELVKALHTHGLASAYIPGLTGEHYTDFVDPNRQSINQVNEKLQPSPRSYSGAMLEVEISTFQLTEYWLPDPDYPDVMLPATMYTIRARVLSVPGLVADFHDLTDWTVQFSVDVADGEELSIEQGQRYLVFSRYLDDRDWTLRNNMLRYLPTWTHSYLPDWDLDTLKPYEHGWGQYEYTCQIADLVHGLSAGEMRMFRTVDINPVENGLVPLEGSVEEFLESPAGAQWQLWLEEIRINSAFFPVLATTALETHASFVLGRTEISQGRGFTQAEAAEGAAVCIISENMAKNNGLKLGDTLQLQYLNYDMDSQTQDFISQGKGVVNPAPYTYYDGMTMSQALTYTIVGIYQQDSPWGSVEENMYAFTPNTIFVPKASVTGSVDHSTWGQFTTLELYNDTLRDFQLLSVDAGYESLFQYYNSGYDLVARSLEEFEAAALQVLPIGMVVYALLMFLYIFLFPARERPVLARMDCLGANSLRRVGHVVGSVISVLLPGSLLGAWLSIQLWDYVAQALKTYMGTDIEVVLNTDQLWAVSGLQALGVILLCGLLGAVLSYRAGAMGRK